MEKLTLNEFPIPESSQTKPGIISMNITDSALECGEHQKDSHD